MSTNDLSPADELKIAYEGGLEAGRRFLEARRVRHEHPPVELGTLDDGTPILGLRDTDAAGTPHVVSTADGPDYHFTLDEDGYIGISAGKLQISDEATLADALRLRELLTGDSLERMVAAANTYLGCSLEIPGYSDKTPPSYQRGLHLLEPAVLLLGQKAPRILASVIDVLTMAQPAPIPVKHAGPWHPEPDEWSDRIRIGEIDGAPVDLVLMWDEHQGRGVPYAVACELGGLQLEVDRHEVTILGAVVTGCGDVALSDLGALIELHQGGQLPRLIELARRFVAEPAEQRRAA